MRTFQLAWRRVVWVAVAASVALPVYGQQVTLVQRKRDPYGYPRPGRAEQQVPLRTSFYIELTADEKTPADTVDAESIGIRLKPEGGEAIDLLTPPGTFASGYSGKIFSRRNRQGNPTTVVYVDTQRPLRPSTTYALLLSARSSSGGELPPKDRIWRFTTESAPVVHPVSFALDLAAPPVRWHGAFFSGFCKPSFCTSHANRIPGYQLMDEVSKRHPKAWSLQRDFWMTGMEHQPKFLSGNLPNAVRELQTRRITKIQTRPDEILLHVEDFFGHQQYGIPSGRPVSDDYHRGDEVLIADGVSDARAEVLETDDSAGTVLVSSFESPRAGWKIEYAKPLPLEEDPNAPGLFPPGGCYLRKFRPAGTPRYYWGRIDKEWDLAHKRFGRRLMPNFADAPGDLSVDGRNWTTAKDYAELHEVVRAMTGHLIDRYGDASLDFVWDVLNEPDLQRAFWRSDWNELQKFYDYTVDGILRAFEDRGYDSDRVFVGGLELGAIFGTNLRLRDFLVHCSPRAESKKALRLNAAVADPRLDGQRSRRVEALCRAHEGKGSPCDFISVHSYNRSEMTAAKLARAKEMALEVDPVYYAELWINSHETCPGWSPPPDPAAADSYLGNGYFPTWCADVIRRQLSRAAVDPAYAFGETILTFWPWPNSNFTGANACTRVMHVDDDGDGQEDRTLTLPMPIFHFLDLTSGMGGDYQVLPEKTIGGHVISGFASRTQRDLRMVLYTHHGLDTQSRSEAEFDFTLELTGLDWSDVRVDEYRFDKDHNSYFRLGRRLREASSSEVTGKAKAAELRSAIEAIGSSDRETQLAGLEKVAALGVATQPVGEALYHLAEKTDDKTVRTAALRAFARLKGPRCYPAQEIEKVESLATLRPTNSSKHRMAAEGPLRLTVRVAANGVNFLIIGPGS